jgi:bifunctional non-homologous end joining protein LigD
MSRGTKGHWRTQPVLPAIAPYQTGSQPSQKRLAAPTQVAPPCSGPHYIRAKPIRNLARAGYIRPMPSYEFCLPTLGKAVPAGPEWFHEIKYDGYRLRIERDGDRVRLITKGGYDWTRRYPRIVEAALKNRQKRFVIDGEAIIRGVDGYSDFNALHSGRHNSEVELIAFDVLVMDDDDLRGLPLSMRKANLQRLLSRRPDGIFVSEFEQGEIGPDLFRKACKFGLEGLVSKRADRPYRGGRSKDWGR